MCFVCIHGGVCLSVYLNFCVWCVWCMLCVACMCAYVVGFYVTNICVLVQVMVVLRVYCVFCDCPPNHPSIHTPIISQS